jgi:hypothetical protein
MNLLRDRRLILYIFLGLRLTLLLVYQPYIVNNTERGLATFGDFQTYYTFAALSGEGRLPYRDFWYEFPPVFPIVSLAAYAITGGGFTPYATLLGLIMTAFDVANLLLLIQIGGKLHSEQTGLALGWIYALMAAPLVLTWWTFEPTVTFSVLASLAALIGRRDVRAALWAAFGALIKLWPLALIGVALRYRRPPLAARFALIAGGITAIGVAAMLIIGGRFGVPSLTAQFNKASYETVWALLDGNYKTGNFGPVADRLDPAKAAAVLGNPALIPGWLRLLVFGGLGAIIYATTRRFDNRGLVAFASITITLFFLWAQGWSPQWQTTLIPLILINFPSREGVLACIALSFASFLEYPVLFARTGDTGGAIAGAQIPLFAAVVVARTLLLAAFAAALYRTLRRTAPAVPDPQPAV